MTPTLKTEPNIPAPDDFYEALLAAHRDLTREQSEALNARIILLLANHVGHPSVAGRGTAGCPCHPACLDELMH